MFFPDTHDSQVEEDDNFRRELSTALQMETNIVPVTDNFQWPEPDSLPEVLAAKETFIRTLFMSHPDTL